MSLIRVFSIPFKPLRSPPPFKPLTRAADVIQDCRNGAIEHPCHLCHECRHQIHRYPLSIRHLSEFPARLTYPKSWAYFSVVTHGISRLVLPLNNVPIEVRTKFAPRDVALCGGLDLGRQSEARVAISSRDQIREVRALNPAMRGDSFSFGRFERVKIFARAHPSLNTSKRCLKFTPNITLIWSLCTTQT